MTKTANKKELQTVVLFGEELEKKSYSVQEIVNLLKNRFNDVSSIEVGRVSYYLLGLKYLGLSNLSYNDNVMIIKKFFEVNGMTTETTDKCQAFYMNKIKSGKINLNEDFKSSGRKKEIINLDSIIF